jgi:hypothetical protein
VTSLQALLSRLGRIAGQLDPVPAMTYELGYASFELRRLDARLAELVSDSADSERLVGVRGGSGGSCRSPVVGGVRVLTYQAPQLSVEVQVTYDQGRRWLVGQVDGTATDLRVENKSGIAHVTLDEVGRFRVEDLPPGLFRLHLAGAGSEVTTSWVTA